MRQPEMRQPEMRRAEMRRAELRPGDKVQLYCGTCKRVTSWVITLGGPVCNEC